MALFAIICCWSYLSITLHEFGHFHMAKQCGMRPISVVIGTGPTLLQLNMKKTPFTFLMLPKGGRTKATSQSLWNIKKVRLLFYGAGPAVNILLLSILLVSLALIPSSGDEGTDIHGTLAILALVEAYIITINLLPRTIKASDTKLHSDGKQLFDALHTTQHEIETEILSDFMHMTAPYMQEGSQAADKSPPFSGDRHATDMFFRGQMAIAVGDYETALPLFEELAKSPLLNAGEKALVFDSLASLATVHGQRTYLHRAKDWIDRAQRLSQGKTLQASRGAVLVEHGSLIQGEELLLPFIDPGNPDIDREISAAYLCKVHFLRGNMEQAANYLKLAESIGKLTAFTNRIRKETLGSLRG